MILNLPVMAFSAGMDVLFAFAISYSIPYLLGTPGANLSARVGFVFMGWCAGTWILTFLLVPEVTGRSLEEVDELFDVSAPLRAARITKHKLTPSARAMGLAVCQSRDHRYCPSTCDARAKPGTGAGEGSRVDRRASESRRPERYHFVKGLGGFERAKDLCKRTGEGVCASVLLHACLPWGLLGVREPPYQLRNPYQPLSTSMPNSLALHSPSTITP